MGWAIGYDGVWKRDIGYGVVALQAAVAAAVLVERSGILR